jgi:hypothetical protein
MMAAMVDEKADMADVRKYFAALRRAQTDIDLHAHRYTHFYKREFPERFRDRMDTRLFGPGERIVFEPYTREMYERTHRWMVAHRLFDGADVMQPTYESAVI